MTQAHTLLHGNEAEVFGDAGYQGVGKRAKNQNTPVTWHVAMRPGKRRGLNKHTPLSKPLDRRASQGQCAGQVGTPVPGDQTAFRSHQGKFHGTAENHRATHYSVCLQQSLDGAEANCVGRRWMSSAAIRQ